MGRPRGRRARRHPRAVERCQQSGGPRELADVSNEQLRTLYGLTVSIGSSLDLDAMLGEGVVALLERLDCHLGGVFFIHEDHNAEYAFEEVLSLPTDTASSAAYATARARLPQGVGRTELEAFLEQLPLHGRAAPEQHFHVLQLGELGALVLVKRGPDLDPVMARSLGGYCDRLAAATRACLQNAELVEQRQQMQDLIHKNIALLQKTSQELIERNKQLNTEIAERKRIEEDLNISVESAKSSDRAKSAFLANMSHEVRTPLNAIIGLTDLALKEPLAATVQDHLDKVRSSSRTLLELINDILDFSKIEAGKMDLDHANFDLRELLSRLVDLMGDRAANKRLELLISIDPTVPCALIGDSLRLGQVLTNLVSNAIKFTDQGEVVVRVRPSQVDSDLAALEFTVQDSGIGIERGELERLFDSFTQVDVSTTRTHGGSGLGLAICRRLVDLMGSRIVVDSSPGAGSSFSFVVTLDRQPAHCETVFAPPKQLQDLNVLVVDDNHTSAEILVDMITAYGYRATAVTSGEAAIEETISALSERPYDLVVLDYLMPGMDGLQTYESLSNHPALVAHSPKPLIVTACASDDVEIEARKVGLDNVLLKPVSQSTLYNAILKVFGRESAAIRVSARRPTAQVLPQLRDAVVLVAEDVQINQDIVRAILEDAGARVIFADNGKEAVEAVRAYEYDAVLMDIQMPEMDGLDATRTIRAEPRFAQLPIIAMTAHAMAGDRERCLSAGMTDYLSKPIDSELLLSKLAQAVDAGSQKSGDEPPSGGATEHGGSHAS